MPRFQTLRDEKKFVKFKISLRGAARGDYLEEFGIASHRWETAAKPDHSREQVQKVQEYLRENKAIKYFWYDYWCMPQCEFDDSKTGFLEDAPLVYKDCKRDDRSESEKADFGRMLKNVNPLYLGMNVLLIVDDSYGKCQPHQLKELNE